MDNSFVYTLYGIYKKVNADQLLNLMFVDLLNKDGFDIINNRIVVKKNIPKEYYALFNKKKLKTKNYIKDEIVGNSFSQIEGYLVDNWYYKKVPLLGYIKTKWFRKIMKIVSVTIADTIIKYCKSGNNTFLIEYNLIFKKNIFYILNDNSENEYNFTKVQDMWNSAGYVQI